ncbi:MAG: hypothetical protein Q8S73_12550, partial [Deltaproteobacteria bacterium]|nr:hypothetical protein [Deltaproteobacteria bacterium]
MKRRACSSFVGVIAACLATSVASAQTPPTARVAVPTLTTAPAARSADAVLGTTEPPTLAALREA